MRLTMQTDFALRMLMQLATASDRIVTIKDVADTYHVSRNHLMKVAYLLGKMGFVETIRGRAGGLRLARPAEEISIGEVVRCMEPDFGLVECLQRPGCGCVIEPACRLRGLLAEATASFLAVLDRHTLAELTERNLSLEALVG